jgi:hypothetical protein
MKLLSTKLRPSMQITIETERLVVVRRRNLVWSWCEQCRADTEFVPAEQIRGFLGDQGRMARQSASGVGLHLGKAPDGSALVCVTSLLRRS